MRGVTVAILVLAFAFGHKNRPIAPELVRPETPEQLSATATPDGVRIGWLRPTKYSGGQRMNDLGGFLIERATGCSIFALHVDACEGRLPTTLPPAPSGVWGKRIVYARGPIRVGDTSGWLARGWRDLPVSTPFNPTFPLYSK